MSACGSTSTGSSDTTQGDDPSVSPQDTEAEDDPFEPDSLPELDFGGKTITFFIADYLGSGECYVEEQTGDIVNDAIWKRNADVCERLNVEFAYREEPGAWDNRKTFAEKLGASVMAGDHAYDIVSGYSMAMTHLTANAMLCDLNSLPYLDFSKPWWSEKLLTQATVCDKLYIASGDISPNFIYYMYGCYFNKSLMTDYGLTEPYQAVLDGTWTLDRVFTDSKGVYKDLNGNQKKDFDDQYGFEIAGVFPDSLYFASGLRTTDLDADGIPQISKDLSSEKVHDLIVKVNTFLYETDDGFYSDEKLENYNSHFQNGRSLYTIKYVSYASKSLRTADFNYGILPLPKYDEKQSEYYTCLSFPFNLFGIPLDANDPAMSAAVLEAMASAGYRTVSPALFEVALKVKYSSDDYASQMYDILRASTVWDFGRIFTDNLGTVTYSMFRKCILNNQSEWMSTYSSNEANLKALLNTLIDGIREGN